MPDPGNQDTKRKAQTMNDTPTSLPGNPEAEAVARLTAATTVAAEGDPSANVLALLTYTQATLALAFEQRTANLITEISMQALLDQQGITLSDDAIDELNARLGLGGDDDL